MGTRPPDQRWGLHKLLRALRLALVLDDSDPAALRVAMGCDGEVWDWQPFLGTAEAARLFVEGWSWDRSESTCPAHRIVQGFGLIQGPGIRDKGGLLSQRFAGHSDPPGSRKG